MKSILLSVLLLVLVNVSFAQTQVFHENFELPSLGDSVSSVGTPAWSINTTYYASGSRSMHNVPTTVVADTLFLVTNSFSTLGSSIVTLKFSHICKLEHFDIGDIEVSDNGGATWTKLNASQYLGASQYGAIGNRFTATSYPTDWDPSNNNTLPTNSWWKTETFNISSIAGNKSNVKVRFSLSNGISGIPGSAGAYGWLIDDIIVTVPAAQEASLVKWSLPLSLPSGCGLSNETIKIKVKNNGGGSILGNLSASFQRIGTAAVTEVIPATILSGDSLEYTFINKINLIPSGGDTTFNVKVWISLPNDPYLANDTLNDTVQVKIAITAPAINDTTIPYNTNVTLHANSVDTIFWYSDPLGQNQLAQGPNFTTPVLLDTTIFYTQAKHVAPGQGQNLALQAVATHSAGGASASGYGPELYNDNNICAYETTGTYLWGWVSSGANIEFTWPIAKTFEKVIIYNAQSTRRMYNSTWQYWNGTAYVDFYIYNNPNPDSNVTVTFPPVTSTKFRINNITGGSSPNFREIQVFGQSFGGCPSIVKPVKVMISGMPRNDAGVSQISSPTGVLTSGTPYPVNVKIKNFGVDTLKKVTINWSVNGIAKTPYLWTGAMAKNGVSTNITLGTQSFTSGVHKIKVWTSSPNDSLDWANMNDTLISQAFVCLSGAMTVGGPTADFPTLASVKTVLDSVGICGPVVFNILPGVYTEQVKFTNVPGSSGVNTITFQSSTANKNDVTIQFAANATSNYTIQLNGADYFRFKNLTIKANDITNGRVIELINGSDSNIFNGNSIISAGTSSSSTQCIYDYTTINSYNSYTNNTIIGGYYAFYMYGSSAAMDKGTLISNNDISGFYLYGIYAYYNDSIQILNNYIHDGANTYHYGIYSYYSINGYKIMNNKIIFKPTGYAYALYDYYGNYYSINPNPIGFGLIANNFISISTGTGANYGMYAYYSNGSKYYHNSINITAGSATGGYGIYQGNTASNTYGQEFKNNIVVNKAGYYCFYAGTPANISVSDYNNFYTGTGNFVYWGGTYANLTALQAGSGKDMNSKSIDPIFASPTDLHLNNVALNNLGTPAGVLTDIDGDTRSLTTPDIGADEYNIITLDAALGVMTAPITACPNNLENISVQVKNMGIDSLKSYTINWSVNGVVQTPLSATDTILYGSQISKTIGTYTFLANVNYALKFWVSNPNGGIDQNHNNDTLFIPVFKTSLPAGTYTIGATGSDYPSFNAALNDLKIGGICGPVVFNVANGTYNEQLDFPMILGASAINTITFKSTSGDSSAVILTSAAALGNFSIRMTGTKFVTFKGITIKATNATNAYVVYMTSGASNNTFTHCVIESSIGTSSSAACVYTTSTTLEENNTFTYNRILNGYYSFYIYGSSTTILEKNWKIENNIIKDYYYYGMYSYYTDSISFKNNILSNRTGSSTTVYHVYPNYSYRGNFSYNDLTMSATSTNYGFYLYYNHNYIFNANKITTTSAATGSVYALYPYYSNSGTSLPSIISNNMISIPFGTGTHYGIYSYYAQLVNYYNNSVNLTAGSTTTAYSFYHTGGASLNVVNNIFSNTGGGYAYYNATAAAILNSNYNNIYATGTNLGYWGANITSFAAWKTTSGKDANSVSIPSNFIANNNLHIVNNANINGKGTVLSSVLLDFDNELRDTLIPDIGADEFTPPANEVSIVAMYTLGKLSKKASNPHRVMAIIENNGMNNQINYSITLNVSGANNFSTVYTYDTLFSGKRDTILFPPYTSVNFGTQTLTVSIPSDWDTTNNIRTYYQEVTDTVFAFSDTSVVSTNLGYNTGSGLLLAKFYVPGNRVISAVRAYITNSSTVGKKVYGVVVNKQGVILDTSFTKTITATDVNTIVTFPMVNMYNTTVNNDSIFVGLAQVANAVGFYPLGMQAENPARPNSFYGSAITGGAMTQYQQYGRPIIEAVTSDPLTKDIKAISFTNPVSDCNLGNQAVKLKIKNVGADTIFGSSTTLTVGYKLVGTTLPNVIESISATIYPGQEYTHTFASLLNMTSNSVDSTFKFIGFASLLDDAFKTNDTTALVSIVSKKTPIAPIASNISIPYATSGTITGIAADTIAWYATDTSTIRLATGSTYITPILYDTTTYYAESTTKFSNPVLANLGTGTVVNTTTSYPTPYGNYYWGSKDQYLILASELTALGFSAGPINSLAFDVSNVNTCPGLLAFEIKMGHTTQSAMTTTLITSGLNSVYTSASYQPVSGWNTHTFSTPFVWNGTSNIVVDVCFNNSAYITNASVNQTTTSFVSVVNYHTDAAGVCSTTSTGTTYSQRPNMKISALGIIEGCSSSKVPVTVFITGTPANDAGVVKIESPSGSVVSNVSTPVLVRVKNFGTSVLTSATIKYSVNGVYKGSFNATGLNVLKDSTSAPIMIASESFAPGIITIKAWTDSVNLSAGLFPQNDTTTSTFYACFAGTITVGASGADYPTPWAAIQAIKIAGVCGPVVVSIQPGTYTGQIDLSGLTGWIPANTLTLTSSTGNKNDVTIQYSATSTTDNYVVKFDNSDYIIIKNLTLKALSTSYGKVIELSNGSSYNIIYNNIISSPTTTSSNTVPIYSSSTGMDQYNVIRKNQILNGYYGVYIYGNSTTLEKGLVLDSNEISEFYYYGAYVSYQDSFIIHSNTLTGSNAGTTSYGLYSYYNQNQGRITNNKIHVKASTTIYALYIYYNTFLPSSPGLIANNFVSNENTLTTTYMLYSYYSNYVNYYNNNIVTNSGSTTGYCVYQTGGSATNFVNNNFVNNAGGYAYYIGTPSAVTASNYNNYYTVGPTLAYWNGAIANLAALKTASAMDANSKSVNPMFTSVNDLHQNSIDLNNAGLFMASVPIDIDGQLRSTTTPDIGADEFTPPADDAGVVALSSPTSPSSPVPSNVIVNIRNFGTNPLTSATINWTINGVLQTPFSWTGNLASTATSGSITIGTTTLPLGLNTLKMWTSLPNGVTDGNIYNDTLKKTIFSCTAPYNGTYTVGGSSANFPTLTDALNALKYCTISGPVILNINPGTYNEQVIIGNIPGVSATNKITIQSSTGISSDVIFTFNATSAANFTFKLDSAKYVTIRKITIKASNATTGRVVELAGGTKYCILDSNKIETVYGTSSTSAGIYSYTSLDEYNEIRNNQIINGYYGVYLYGASSTSQERNNIIENNTISGFYYYGIYLYYQKNTVVRRNSIQNGNATGVAYGIYSYYTDSAVRYEYNKILLSTTSTTYGMYINYNRAKTTDRGIVANNFIACIGGTGTVYGVYNYYSENLDYVYNSIHIKGGTSAAGRGMYMYYGTGTTLRNNIVNMNNAAAGGNAIYVTPTTAIASSNYNCFYTSGPTFGYFGAATATFAAWQTTSGMDANSISIDPNFLSNTDLHISNVALNGKGIPFTGITTDIDGQIRSTTTPDIGADEFDVVQWDAGVVSFTQPVVTYGPVGNSVTVEIKVKNFGFDTIQSMNLVYRLGTSAPISTPWTGSLLPGATLLYTFTNTVTLPLGQVDLKAWTSLSTDQNLLNDTSRISLTGMPLLSLGWSDNFDGTSNLWNANGIMNVWERGIPQKSTINTAHSAPNVWITDLNDQYLPSDTDYLYSPYFNFNGITGATLKFWQWYKTQSGSDYCRVQFSTNLGQNWSALGYMGDPLATNWYNSNIGGIHAWSGSSSGWQQATYDLTQFDNSPTPVQFRFVFISNASVNDDGWAIDDFEVTIPTANIDAALDSILTPKTSMTFGSIDSVRVRIKNNGSTLLTSIPVHYRINNGAAVTDLWTGSLAAGASTNFTFLTPMTPSIGTSFNICAVVNAVGDLYNQNDSICESVLITPPAKDAGVTQIIEPLGGNDTTCFGKAYQIKVTVKNFGTDPITSMNIQYSVNGVVKKTEAWTGNLAPGATANYTFTDSMVALTGFYALCVKTILPNDAISANDQVCKNLIGHLCIGMEDSWKTSFALDQNIPNPAKGNTQIDFEIPKGGNVHFTITNLLGQNLKSENFDLSSGRHSIEFDASVLQQGVYYYSIEMDGHKLTKKMVIVK